ncbi:hypothetical protein PaG_00056 [Moesziomyces aphidis]|uniref:Uncharacterized protein n=1 Tax=Moesziomyces aphidis TaxID=84754 RepID=W3VWY1_MOEAP|nr:hypothetical protein PaG_00056 [Moesziomyces aphidis]
MLSPTRRPRRSVSRPSINDENASPFPYSLDVSVSMQPSEPPSSPLISNSVLYNLPDPTIGLPASSRLVDLPFLPSPFKRSAIAPLNKPLSIEQTQQLGSIKPRSSSSASLQPSSQANLNAPGGLPTPPNSGEALIATPGPSSRALASLPREPVSPSPTRSRNVRPSPARTPGSRSSRAPSTPLRSQRGTPHRRLTSNNQDGSEDDDLNDARNTRTPSRMQPLREVAEDSDDEEPEQEDEIQLISFRRGGPDATFVREIKENGWDQPMPPSPIKFTYLEPVAPRPRQSSAALRARSQSRSKTPQIRASPAPSHASSSRSSRASRSVRAPSATLADQSADASDESIKSSGSVLTNLSRLSQTTAARASRRKSVARSSIPPPVPTADLTRDHPSLPDSPGDDPLLMTGPNTYILYHNQTPIAKHRGAPPPSGGLVQPSDRDDPSMALSTPIEPASSHRDRSSSAASSDRTSLYSRMSGRPAGDTSIQVANDDDDENHIAADLSIHAAGAPLSDADEQSHAGFMAHDDAGFDSDSDQGDFDAMQAHNTSAMLPHEEADGEDESIDVRGDISSMSDVSRSFADESAADVHGDITTALHEQDLAADASASSEQLSDVNTDHVDDDADDSSRPEDADTSIMAADLSVAIEEDDNARSAETSFDEQDVSIAAPDLSTSVEEAVDVQSAERSQDEQRANADASQSIVRNASTDGNIDALADASTDSNDAADESLVRDDALASVEASFDESRLEDAEDGVTADSEHVSKSVATDVTFDVSLVSDASARYALFPTHIDSALLPTPYVLIPSLADNGQVSSTADLSSLDTSAHQHGDGDVSMDAPESEAVSQADISVSVMQEDTADGSLSSELSSASLQSAHVQEQDDESFRRKYQARSDSTPEPSMARARRLSLSTDPESASDAEEDITDDDQEEDDEMEEANDANESSHHSSLSRDLGARSFESTNAQEHDESGDEQGSEQDELSASNESELSDDDASSLDDSSVDEEDDDDDDDAEEEQASEHGAERDVDEEEQDENDDASSTHSRVDDDESEQLDSVVILSSSASPSVSASHLIAPRDDDAEAENNSYVVSVVRDSRDRTRRASEHSMIDDEPHIHTLHLRQPVTSADATGSTMADASHSRSRVLKLGQATSTPIVEISSLDPRAAARATAILKLFHKYVDEGWISAGDMDATGASSATGERMRRVVDAIRRADTHGRLEDASALQHSLERADGTTSAAADLTTLLMDAELALARQGSADTESLLGSRAASVVSTRRLPTASPATPFLPGGFRATPAASNTRIDDTASPSPAAAPRSRANDSTIASATVSFPGLSTPDRRRRSTAKQARLSQALAAPAPDSFDARVWDTQDWVRLDKYFALGVQKISSRLLSSTSADAGADKMLRARCYMDALFDTDVGEVAWLFLAEMHIAHANQVGEWTHTKLTHRLEALRRKYARKIHRRYPDALQDARALGETGANDSLATEDLDWSVDTTAQGPVEARSGVQAAKGRVSFGTPYRMGAHSTPAVGLLKKATRRAARDAMQRSEPVYPALPDHEAGNADATEAEAEAEEGVMTRASRLISRLSGGFGGLLSSPRPEAPRPDKGKRKATEAELSPARVRRRVEADVSEDSASASSGDSYVESFLSTVPAVHRGLTTTINASMLTNATSVRPDASVRSRKRTTLGVGSQSLLAPASVIASARAGGTGWGSSRQLSGGSSGVSHTPLSLLSPATHRAAAKKVDELRQSRAQRNWTSPRRARLHRPTTLGTGAGDISSSSSGRDGSAR